MLPNRQDRVPFLAMVRAVRTNRWSGYQGAKENWQTIAGLESQSAHWGRKGVDDPDRAET